MSAHRRNRTSRRAVVGLAATAVLSIGACSVDGSPVADESAGDPSGSTTTTSESGSTTAPTGGAPVMADGSFRVSGAYGQPKVVVTVIEDMACPACKNFEQIVGPTLDGYGSDPTVAIDYRVISFLDRVSPDKYSSRAANASYCVWHAGDGSREAQEAWRTFQHDMFAEQPAEGGPGLSDDEIIDIAEKAGVDDIADCVNSGRYASAVADLTDETMSDSDFQGTPTVLVNGDKVTVTSAASVKDAVDDAKG